MTEVALGGDAIAHALFQLGDVGEAAFVLARPHRLAADANDEHAAGAGNERDAAHLLLEGRKNLLGHPGGAQQPAALPAVFDGDREARGIAIRFGGHGSPSGRARAGDRLARRRNLRAATGVFSPPESILPGTRPPCPTMPRHETDGCTSPACRAGWWRWLSRSCSRPPPP